MAMKKTTEKWKAYLELSQKEAWGTALLATGLLGMTALLSLSDYLYQGDPVRILPEDSVRVMRWLNKTGENPEFSAHRSASADPYNGPPIAVETISREQLIALGLPPYLAERWIKYTSKGGKIRYPNDLKRLYGMTPERIESILPHLIFKKTALAQTSFSTNSNDGYRSFPKQTKLKNPSRLDINSADTTQWKTLPGIGSGYARRICSFRDKLGGFVGVEQVMETFQLPPELAPIIEKYGYVGTVHRRIQINHVSEIRHPYLPYAQAKALLAYRTQHGPFRSLDDLKQVKRLTPEVIEKIGPYLSFEP